MIPELNVRQLIAQNRWEGTLAFSFEPEASLLDIPFVSFSGPVRAELAWYLLQDDRVEVEGTLSFEIAGACSRCLCEAAQEIVYRAEGLFVPGEGDGEAYGYRNGRVMLGEFLHDSILFALPRRMLCKACTQWENESEEVKQNGSPQEETVQEQDE